MISSLISKMSYLIAKLIKLSILTLLFNEKFPRDFCLPAIPIAAVRHFSARGSILNVAMIQSLTVFTLN